MAPIVVKSYEVYSETSLGSSLINAFDQFISENKVDPELAVKIVKHFDRIFAEVIKANEQGAIKFEALEHSFFSYRSREETWTLSLEKIEIKLEGGAKLNADIIEIVVTPSDAS